LLHFFKELAINVCIDLVCCFIGHTQTQVSTLLYIFVIADIRTIPYILESNPHAFYSFRGLKYQMRIRIACGLDSLSRAGFLKNDRAAVRAVRTIQLFYYL